MDVCARAVVMAANQYFTSSSNSNMVYLQSQLESLQSHTDNLPSLKFFNTRNMLAVDCLTRVVQILNDPQVKMVLANKCIMVFQNLVQDNDLCTLLQSQFHLSESLASVLKNSVEKQSEGFTLECIQLLMTLTYGQQINFHDNHIKYLLKFLVKQICSSASELTQPCLGLLANICRKNITVQIYIRSLECSKLCRALLNFLLDQNKTNVIFSLSVITSVFQHEVLGEKVLSGANLRNTLQLLFNLLINGDAGITRRYAVDVFTDISKSPKILHSLLKYEHLPICLENTLNLLTSSVPDSVAKIFELLIEFSSTAQMRTSICSIMLRCQPLRDLSQLETLLRKPVNQSSYPLLATIHWASQPIEATDTHTASLLAIDLLKEIFEEVLFSDDKNNMSRNHVEVMVCLLIKILRENCQQPVDTSDTKTQEKTTKVLQFLTVLCSDDDVKKLIASQVNVDMFRTILQHQFNQNKHMYQINNSSKNHTASDIDVEVILLSLNLMSKLRRHVINLDDYFKLQLQDSRLVPFLATYITSANRDHVQTALQLVSTAASLDIFLDVVLCDSVATMNVRKEEVTAVVVPERTTVLSDISYNKENTNNTILPLTTKHTMSDEDNKTMQNLILKMETNLEMKDSKVSDIIQLYEHQLQSLKTNEEHLENLLKTKTLELVQSDRLISQYRLNGARVESESHNLRKMLQESERKSEEYLEQMNDMRLKLNNLETTVDQLDQENERLTTRAEEYEELKAVHSEIADREERLSRSLTVAQQELKAQTELHDMLQKHHTTLKKQNDIASDQLFTLEKECKQQQKLIKEKDTNLTETTKSLCKLEKKYSSLQKEKEDLERDREELEKATEGLRSEVSKLADVKKNLQMKVSSLERVCQEHEAAIAKKDELISEKEEQISKHSQIAALIQSLSGGNKKSADS